MKNVATAIGVSMLSPVIVGSLLGMYFVFVYGDGELFWQLLTTAIANAHIVGISMAVCVLPTYHFLYKRNKVTYSAVMTTAMIGGAVLTYLFSVSGGPIIIANSIMCSLGAALFLYSLRRHRAS
ncbi:hypothetical protein N474_09240 [Pseudoalteromonas luteoviolacea CPMOR-2]|uniref:hypothetical protein n=1 Tax=Pseudoalteromonas luteoviolacea TaxID=43657 RepID=UPI0007B065D5|nr:hypothetical protein [Pseudoalteromonas luteoviolacea]KZN57180.1 hypothetical protein N474_09240 [Pseudoalteromonas luteoviolacea CPMOR-2]